MNWPKFDQRLDQDAEILPRRGGGTGGKPVGTQRDHAASDDGMAEAALGMISDAAAAIRQLEQHAAIAVERARSIADATIEKLNVANARADRAERGRQKAETEVADLRETLETARTEAETLRAQLVATENELTAARHRASEAERRADEAERRAAEANAAVERIVSAIREQFPAGVGSADSGVQRK